MTVRADPPDDTVVHDDARDSTESIPPLAHRRRRKIVDGYFSLA
jgi:hypothetical protein